MDDGNSPGNPQGKPPANGPVAGAPGAAVSSHTLQIQVDDDVAQGVYANLAMINHTDGEFTLDFIYVQPQQPRAKVRARVISSPRHTKRILQALAENVARYEARFGRIDTGAEGSAPAGPLGPSGPAAGTPGGNGGGPRGPVH